LTGHCSSRVAGVKEPFFVTASLASLACDVTKSVFGSFIVKKIKIIFIDFKKIMK
jgi:hypothetical protein